MISNLAKSYLLSLIFPLAWVLAFDVSWAKETSKTKSSLGTFSALPPMITPVRIGLATRSTLVRFALWPQPANLPRSAWQSGFVFVDGTAACPLALESVYSIMDGKIIELATGRSFALPKDKRVLISSPYDCVWVNNRWYRGCLEIITYAHSATVINLLDLENYLRGVVPAEMPANWHFEALKAQAIAARSYAWAHLDGGSKWSKAEGYDLVPDVRDQVYKGVAVEADASTKAVYATRGVVLKNSGRVKPGFYRAWVGDDFENLNIRRYVVSASLLAKITGVPGIIGVTVRQWDPSGNGNVRSIQVMGANKKTREVSGVALARMLDFATAGILDAQEEGTNWVFTCRGPGNGARGLSQTGANKLALGGWKCEQILQQYYQDPDGKVRLDFTDGVKLYNRMYYERTMFKSVEHEPAQEFSQSNDSGKE